MCVHVSFVCNVRSSCRLRFMHVSSCVLAALSSECRDASLVRAMFRSCEQAFPHSTLKEIGFRFCDQAFPHSMLKVVGKPRHPRDQQIDHSPFWGARARALQKQRNKNPKSISAHVWVKHQYTRESCLLLFLVIFWGGGRGAEEGIVIWLGFQLLVMCYPLFGC